MSYNVSSVLPNYQSLTADNFFIVLLELQSSGESYGSDRPYTYTNAAITYNPSTGVVSAATGRSAWACSANLAVYSKVRLYYTETPLPTS